MKRIKSKIINPFASLLLFEPLPSSPANPQIFLLPPPSIRFSINTFHNIKDLPTITRPHLSPWTAQCSRRESKTLSHRRPFRLLDGHRTTSDHRVCPASGSRPQHGKDVYVCTPYSFPTIKQSIPVLPSSLRPFACFLIRNRQCTRSHGTLLAWLETTLDTIHVSFIGLTHCYKE